MKKFIFFIVMLGAFSILSLKVSAQGASSNHNLLMGIPEVCLLTAPSANISLILTTSTAGTAISGGTGFGYTQISSIVSASELRTITALVTGVPAGTSLAVTTEVPTNANKAGILGTGTTNVNLSGTAANLVTEIGSCYTGVAADDGYKLTYLWNAGTSGNYGTIVATAGASAVVVLTVTNQ